MSNYSSFSRKELDTTVSGIEIALGNKLDAEDYTPYSHPENHAAAIITQDSNNRFVTDTEKSVWNGKATQSDINNSIANLVATAPDTLNTLNELASALGNDPSFATTVLNSLSGKQNKLLYINQLKDIEITDIDYDSESNPTLISYANNYTASFTYINSLIDTLVIRNASSVVVEQWSFTYDASDRLLTTTMEVL